VQDTHGGKWNTMVVATAVAWAIVPIVWGIAAALARTEPWEGTPVALYGVGSVVLLGAGALTLIIFVKNRSRASTPVLAAIGLGVVGLGVAASVVSWAIPLWATVYGVGMVLVAGSGVLRRVAAIMGVAFLGSTAAFSALTVLEVGTADRYGDYPIAGAVAIALATLGPALALLSLARSTDTNTALAPDPVVAS